MSFLAIGIELLLADTSDVRLIAMRSGRSAA